jgi:hypothetical protein
MLAMCLELNSSTPVNAGQMSRNTCEAGNVSDLVGSSADGVSVSNQRQITICSKHGISKPKIYTNGMIIYGFLASVGEPSSLHDAMNNSNWKKVPSLVEQ